MTVDAEAAREALRERQGAGARYDSSAAPVEALLLARRATAYFARKLSELDDRQLFEPLTGSVSRTRAHVVACVGYGARRMALTLEPLSPSDPRLPPETFLDDLPALDLAATLPATALRHLFHHAAIHLDVCWRDLPHAAWGAQVASAQRLQMSVSETPVWRAVALWQGALALGNGDWEKDVPEALRERIAETAGSIWNE